VAPSVNTVWDDLTMADLVWSWLRARSWVVPLRGEPLMLPDADWNSTASCSVLLLPEFGVAAGAQRERGRARSWSLKR
jgi:hypothetical protein